MPTLNPAFKDEAYESENEYEDVGEEMGSETGFKMRKDEDYEQS
jgi:hypothetical protein